MTLNEIAASVRGRRVDLGMSQAELANRAGVSRKWVYEFEAGKPTAEFGLLMRVLDSLDLDFKVTPKEVATEWSESSGADDGSVFPGKRVGASGAPASASSGPRGRVVQRSLADLMAGDRYRGVLENAAIANSGALARVAEAAKIGYSSALARAVESAKIGETGALVRASEAAKIGNSSALARAVESAKIGESGALVRASELAKIGNSGALARASRTAKIGELGNATQAALAGSGLGRRSLSGIAAGDTYRTALARAALGPVTDAGTTSSAAARNLDRARRPK